jgi:hypothetical protein
MRRTWGPLMPTSEDYRHKAEECRRLAEHAHKEIERGSLLRMAAQFEVLAKRKAAIEDRKAANWGSAEKQ